MEKNKFGKMVLWSFIVGVLALAYFQDYLFDNIAKGTLFGIFLYFISDFKNWVIILSAVFLGRRFDIQDDWRSFMAGILIVLASDIVSFPRLLYNQTQFDSMKASFDYIAVTKIMEWTSMSYNSAWITFYVIIPIASMFLAVKLLGLARFGKNFSSSPLYQQ